MTLTRALKCITLGAYIYHRLTGHSSSVSRAFVSFTRSLSDFLRLAVCSRALAALTNIMEFDFVLLAHERSESYSSRSPVLPRLSHCSSNTTRV